ncbi:MAG: YkgJ family cysteine cluster protein, partial [Desulfobacterales bacterium]
DDDGFYFFVHEAHCLGFEEKKEWTVREWRKDQGVDIHDEINAGWTDLVVRKRSFPPNLKLVEESKKMFFLVSYNIDKFKQFVFESSFLNRYAIDPATVEKIRKDEIALLKFGLKWLKDVLYKEGSFKPKESTAD